MELVERTTPTCEQNSAVKKPKGTYRTYTRWSRCRGRLQQPAAATKSFPVHTRGGRAIASMQLFLSTILPMKFHELNCELQTCSEDKTPAKPRHTLTGRVAETCLGHFLVCMGFKLVTPRVSKPPPPPHPSTFCELFMILSLHCVSTFLALEGHRKK